MDVAPIIKIFDSLLTAGAAVGLAATAFFVMLAGFQYMSAGGSVRAVESAKGSLYNALIGFAVVILCKIIAGLVGGALGAPGTAQRLRRMALGPMAWTLWLRRSGGTGSTTMPRVYELPTHLQVEDMLIAGLTARQLVRLMVGASLAMACGIRRDGCRRGASRSGRGHCYYRSAVRAAPAGRPPAGPVATRRMLFVALPRRLVWRPSTAHLRRRRPTVGLGRARAASGLGRDQ